MSRHARRGQKLTTVALAVHDDPGPRGENEEDGRAAEPPVAASFRPRTRTMIVGSSTNVMRNVEGFRSARRAPLGESACAPSA